MCLVQPGSSRTADPRSDLAGRTAFKALCTDVFVFFKGLSRRKKKEERRKKRSKQDNISALSKGKRGKESERVKSERERTEERKKEDGKKRHSGAGKAVSVPGEHERERKLARRVPRPRRRRRRGKKTSKRKGQDAAK